MKSEVSYHGKPGALQQGIVLTLCILFLIAMVYVGLQLMSGEPVVENLLGWIEKIKG